MKVHFDQAIRNNDRINSSTQVYRFDPRMREVVLEYKKGVLKLAYIETQAPDGERLPVAVKIYSKAFFRQNPELFIEFQTNVYYMQTLGDNVYVLGCIEALQDDRCYYVISPWCEDGDLLQDIPQIQPRSITEDMEEHKKAIYRKVLECLQYIYSHGICHGDIKIEHFLKSGDRILLTNFSKAVNPSLIIDDWSINRASCASDLRACNKIFFLVLTGVCLYEDPLVDDYKDQYFIECEGLSESDAKRPQRDALFLACNNHQRNVIFTCLLAIRTLSPALRTLIANIFTFKPDPAPELTPLQILQEVGMVKLNQVDVERILCDHPDEIEGDLLSDKNCLIAFLEN